MHPSTHGLVLLLTDASGSVHWANHRATRLLQEVRHQPGSRHVTDLVHRDERSGVEMLLRGAAAGPAETVVRMRNPEGATGPVEERHLHLCLSPGNGTEVVVQGWDVSVLVRQIHELEIHAHHDSLTGLANRVVFMDRLEHEVARSGRTGTDVAVLFADVDGLKAVNDTYGHEAGDDVLRALARRFTRSLRPGDTLARMGGDEFAVVCGDLLSPGQALQVVDRLRAAAAEPVRIRGGQVSVSLSVGVAFASGATEDDPAVTLLRRADEAMYDLKPRRSSLSVARRG